MNCKYCSETKDLVRGMCNRHYKQVMKYGEPRTVAPGRPKKIECECGRPATENSPTEDTKICKTCYDIARGIVPRKYYSFREVLLK